MQYRTLGKSKKQVSILGFGCMRFPTDDAGLIDREPAEAMVLKAIEGGVNYLDTAYPYHQGESELFVGELVKKHNLRKEVFIATKCPSWLIKTREDMETYLKEQLDKLQTDHVDFYLLHTLNKTNWETYKANGVFDFIETQLRLGTIGEIGFSFHDDYDVFETIVNDFEGWGFCQIQLNYMDQDYQAGIKGLTLAKEKGIDVIVMEPLKGGNLTQSVPKDVQVIFDEAKEKRSPAKWALDYVFQLEGVQLVLSGMSTMDQVTENIEIADSTKGSLTEAEQHIINRVSEIYNQRTKVPCTACGYCMPCPFGVDIPGIFADYNQGSRYNNMDGSKWHYQNPLKDKQATLCTRCGACLENCPQFIEIPDRLEEAHEALKA